MPAIVGGRLGGVVVRRGFTVYHTKDPYCIQIIILDLLLAKFISKKKKKT